MCDLFSTLIPGYSNAEIIENGQDCHLQWNMYCHISLM